MPCCVCGKPADDPHHLFTAGTSIKGSDFSCVPMCRLHHHEDGLIGRDTFAEKHSINLYAVALKRLVDWCDMKLEEESEEAKHLNKQEESNE